jgi:hypothetical protein
MNGFANEFNIFTEGVGELCTDMFARREFLVEVVGGVDKTIPASMEFGDAVLNLNE